MSNEKTGLGKLLQKIGNFFEGLFFSSEKVWNNLSHEIQDAFLQGSQILEIINRNVDEDGDFLLQLILKTFPDLDVEKLRAGLLKVMEALNISKQFYEQDTVPKLLETIAAYLKSKEKEIWANATSTAAKLISLSLSGNLVSYATLEVLMTFVYHNFIKGQDSFIQPKRK